ncbi:hypothetical protein LQZ39_25760, partial [Enterobacter cloacae complex sp. RIVM_C039474]|uniref:hypothetical protein n=1 Tax=Enterobacter cloacae complex sp. RIVM_C039474 TaxID=2900327 RepID=UPI0023417B27
STFRFVFYTHMYSMDDHQKFLINKFSKRRNVKEVGIQKRKIMQLLIIEFFKIIKLKADSTFSIYVFYF